LALVNALNKVDLPTLGRPTMPIERLTCASLERIAGWACPASAPVRRGPAAGG
jgi:hypothetical protein